jgi:hypothetical protein
VTVPDRSELTATLQYGLDDIDGVLVSLYVASGLVTFGIIEGVSPLGVNWGLDGLLFGGSGWGVSYAMAFSMAILGAVFITNRMGYSGSKDYWGMNQIELISFFGTLAILIGVSFFTPLNDAIGSNIYVSYGGYFLSYAGLYGAGWSA